MNFGLYRKFDVFVFLGNGNCASKEDDEKLEEGEHLLLSQNQRDKIEARVEGMKLTLLI